MKIGSLVKIVNNDMSLCFPAGQHEKSNKFFDSIGLVLQLDSDLTKAMGINERMLTVNELFDGDNSAFKAALSALNGLDSYEAAKSYISTQLINNGLHNIKFDHWCSAMSYNPPFCANPLRGREKHHSGVSH